MKTGFSITWQHRVCTACAALLAGFVSTPVLAQNAHNPCGSLQNAYGPFDYRTQRDRLRIVESYHFQPKAEALIGGRGEGGASLGSNIDYTLRASPNHHRALVAMMRYAERVKLPKAPGAEYTVDCYFDRAVRFAPDDLVVRMLFAGHLAKTDRSAEAERHLEFASARAGENAFTLANLGNVYFEMKIYDQALLHLHRAQALGWRRKDLEERLRTVGKWSDAEVAAGAASAPQ